MAAIGIELFFVQISGRGCTIIGSCDRSGAAVAHGTGIDIRGKIDLILPDIQTGAAIEASIAIRAATAASVVTGLPVLFEDDIENASAASRGIVLGGGIGDDLYAFD